MRYQPPSIGIDFGTTNSSMAWYNPKIGQAEAILNAEGEAKTPSVVYFGEDETLVGKPVDELIEDVAVDPEQREDVFRRTVVSIKRNLINPPRIALPGGRYVRPVDVAAEILKKLKRDAEEGYFHEEIGRAVITCPAEFDAVQRKKIEDAGRLAGFGEVVLLEEPVAAALAYARAGFNVGKHVLVYDLGGGTFDLAVLDNEDESLRVAMEPRGMERCGGDDFDLALYYHCDELAREKLGRPISATSTVDLNFLRACRRRKENLSWQERAKFSNYLSSDNGTVRFVHEIERETFEELIDERIENTTRLTGEILEEADAAGHEVDTVVMVGGSSRVPLVMRMLKEALPVSPLGFDKRDLAVALGASHYANMRWPMETGPPPPPWEPTALDKYREAVEAVRDRRLAKVEADRLDTLADQLGLAKEQTAEVERQVLGNSKEGILFQKYRRAVGMIWANEKLKRLELEWLDALADELGLNRDQTRHAESEIMGAAKDVIFGRQRPSYTPPGENFELARTLAGHSDEVHSVAFSPDGRFLASGASDHGVRVWNVSTGESVAVLAGHVGRVSSVVFCPDGQLLASGGFDKTIKIWRLPEAEILHALDHSEWVLSVAVNPHGRFLASGGADKEIKLWDLETGELLRTLTGHSHWVMSLAFTPDGRFLVSGGADKTVKVWDPETGEPLHAFEHPDRVSSVAAGPGGDLIVSGGEDGAIRLCNPLTGKLLCTIAGHPAPVSSVALSPDGRLLLSGGTDGKLKVWNSTTGELLDILFGHSKGIWAIAASRDGRSLASGGFDHAVKIWRKAETGERSPGPNVSGYRSAIEQYRNTVKDVYTKAWGRTGEAKSRLSRFASELGLGRDQAESIEREVIGGTEKAAYSEQGKAGTPRPVRPEEPPREHTRPSDVPD